MNTQIESNKALVAQLLEAVNRDDFQLGVPVFQRWPTKAAGGLPDNAGCD